MSSLRPGSGNTTLASLYHSLLLPKVIQAERRQSLQSRDCPPDADPLDGRGYLDHVHCATCSMCCCQSKQGCKFGEKNGSRRGPGVHRCFYMGVAHSGYSEFALGIRSITLEARRVREVAMIDEG